MLPVFERREDVHLRDSAAGAVNESELSVDILEVKSVLFYAFRQSTR